MLDSRLSVLRQALVGVHDRPSLAARLPLLRGELSHQADLALRIRGSDGAQWFASRPGHFFGGVGLGVSLIGGLILAYLAALKISGEDIGGRPMLILGFMLFLSSVQLITTGILAEMIARTYYRDDAQPNYIVRTVFRKGD